jgi:ketosteroid isomerase-like protein
MRTKAQVLARIKKGKWTVNQIDDLKVAVHGDAAVVTGSWVGKGTDGDGKAVDAKERWADTWVKTAGGKWPCVASASAPTK